MLHSRSSRVRWFTSLALGALYRGIVALEVAAKVLSFGTAALGIFLFVSIGWNYTRQGPAQIFDHPWSRYSGIYLLQFLADLLGILVGYILWLCLGVGGLMFWWAVESFFVCCSCLRITIGRWREKSNRSVE